MLRYLTGLMVALVLAGKLFAAPMDGEWMDFEQPDRSPIKLKVYGDEFYARLETGDGYTVVKDPDSGWFCYAELSASGDDLVSTGIPYASGGVPPQPSPPALAAHLKRSRRFPSEKRLRLKAGRRKAIGAENRRKLRELEAQPAPGTQSAPAPADPIQASALTGAVRGLTLLIQFPDVPGTIPQATVEAFCNQPGWAQWSNNGSVHDFWYDVSGGKIDYTNQVTGYYTARNPRSYYTDNTVSFGTRARELITEALNALNAQGFDFSTLSTDSSKRIRAINAFYAGAVVNQWSEGLWPHKSTLSPVFSADGVSSGSYQISGMGSTLSIGTFCHENGHMLMGWPDLYDYDYDSSGSGNFCLMSSSGSTNPRPPQAWLRHDGGWTTPIDLNAAAPGTVFTVSANSVSVFRYKNVSNSAESFYIEALRRTGRGTTFPDEGLAVWHIDTKGSNNYQDMTLARHYQSSLEQADGRFDLENNANSGDTTDLFTQSQGASFSDLSLPGAKWWNGAPSGLVISEISASGDTMSFRLGTAPAGTATAVLTPSRSATPTRSPTPRPSATATPTFSASPSASATPSASPSFTLSATPTPSPSATPSPAVTATPTATPSPRPSATPQAGVFAVPGRLQAEDYSAGHDSTAGNRGGVYRGGDVDIEACSDSGGGYDVAWTAAGEWLDFELNVASAGTYVMRLRMASAQASPAMILHFELDGARLTPNYSIPQTGGWQAWVTYSTSVSLPGGRHRLRAYFDAGGYNLNYLDLAPQVSGAPMDGAASPLREERLEDKGGQGGRGGLPGGRALLVGPNPTKGLAAAHFRLDVPARVRLVVSNLAGGMVAQENMGRLEAGEHEQSLDLRGLAPGLLFVTLQADQGAGWRNLASFKLVLMR
jgi:M6 family metalloprotease-like protein